jgi:hypothetical protein
MRSEAVGSTDHRERTHTRAMVGLHDYVMLYLHHEAQGMSPEQAADANSKAIATGQIGMSNAEADELIAAKSSARRLEELRAMNRLDTYRRNVDARLSQALGRQIVTVCLAHAREVHRSPRRATATKTASKSDSSDPPGRPPAPAHDGLERLGSILRRLFADLEAAQPQHAGHWRELRIRACAR